MIAAIIQFGKGDGPRLVQLPAIPRVGEYVEYGPATIGKVEMVCYTCHREEPLIVLSYVDLAWFKKAVS